MKKIVVMSDNHGQWRHVDWILKNENDADYFVHCGDNCGLDDDLEKFYAVKGNGDYNSKLPKELRFTTEGLEFGVLHGHQFGYQLSEKTLFKYMKQHHYDILFFGHVHRVIYDEQDGKIIINPGSTARSRVGPNTYAVIYVENGKIENVEFKLI